MTCMIMAKMQWASRVEYRCDVVVLQGLDMFFHVKFRAYGREMIDVCNEFFHCRRVDKKWRDERIAQRVIIVVEIHPFAYGIVFKY